VGNLIKAAVPLTWSFKNGVLHNIECGVLHNFMNFKGTVSQDAEHARIDLGLNKGLGGFYIYRCLFFYKIEHVFEVRLLRTPCIFITF
jgi:hypothetical protein